MWSGQSNFYQRLLCASYSESMLELIVSFSFCFTSTGNVAICMLGHEIIAIYVYNLVKKIVLLGVD